MVSEEDEVVSDMLSGLEGEQYVEDVMSCLKQETSADGLYDALELYRELEAYAVNQDIDKNHDMEKGTYYVFS